MTRPGRRRPFGELESAIMDRLWAADQARSVREVLSELGPTRPLAYTTVMTVLENLHRKGWLDRERDGRAWRYTPTVGRQQYTAELMNDALESSPDRAGALTRFVEQIDTEDAEALARALDEALAQRRGGSPR